MEDLKSLKDYLIKKYPKKDSQKKPSEVSEVSEISLINVTFY